MEMSKQSFFNSKKLKKDKGKAAFWSIRKGEDADLNKAVGNYD